MEPVADPKLTHGVEVNFQKLPFFDPKYYNFIRIQKLHKNTAQ